jgi:hypothetical protein
MDNIPSNEDIRYLEPEVTEERVWNYKNLGIVIFLGVIIVVIAILIITFMNLSLVYKLLIAWILSIIYAAILFFALEPRVLRQIKATAVRTITRIKPVEKKVFIEKPVERTVEKKVFIKKPEPPKYEYCASTQTGTYHKSNCRFSKLIKPKFKKESNDPYDFHSKGFKRCKICFGLGKKPRKKKTKIIEKVIIKRPKKKK